MNVAVKNLEEKLVPFLQATGYFSPVKAKLNHVGRFYGPLGALMKHNILQEWWNPLITRGDDIIFPVSSPNYQSATKENSPFIDNCRSSLSESTSIHIESLLPLVNNRLPFGIAQIGTCVNTHDHGSPLNSIPEQTNMLLQFFCDPTSSTRWFQHWQRKRHLWWRRFSGIPSAFQFSEIQSHNGIQQLDIFHLSSWGKHVVETITLNSSEQIGTIRMKKGRKFITPHLIECTSSLDAAVVAYLLDGYQEKTRQNTLRTVLRLHPKLTPYKAMVVASSSSKAELRELTMYLAQLLKRDNHSVFPCTTDPIVLEEQFIRSDELGIPCCVIVDETTLKSGLVHIRNRDTTLLEDVRISELQKIIQHYLHVSN